MKSKLKHFLSKHSIITKSIIIMLIFSVVSTYAVTALQHQSKVLPNDPLQEKADGYSEVPLFGNNMDLVYADEKQEEQDSNKQEEEQDEGKEQEEQDKRNDENHEKDNQENLNTDEAPDTNKEENPQQGDDKNDSANENTQHKEGPASSDENDGSKHKEIIDGENSTSTNIEEKNDYFTTSIKKDETVTDKTFPFNIKQLDHDASLKDINITINSHGKVKEISDDYSKPVYVQLLLTEGENEITVTAKYEDKSGSTFDVLKTYTVSYDKDDIKIETDLKDKEVTEEELAFTATAKQGNESVPLEVSLKQGDKLTELKQSDESEYASTLKEGKNEILLYAASGDKEAEKTFTVDYVKPDPPEIKIESDLVDYDVKTVKEAGLNFTAAAYADDEEIELNVSHNGESLSSDDNSYQTTLKKGENVFNLEAEKSGFSESASFTVYYEPEAAGGDEEDKTNENAPEITVFDITDGETIVNSIRTFHVKVKDYNGQSITKNGKVSVTNNGEQVPKDWTDEKQVSFTLPINDGTNEIEVHAEDSEGNKATKRLTIYGEAGDEGEPIGTATISMEATTVGLGYLIEPHEVELFRGERASMVLHRILEEYGFDYMNTGSLENNFYLSAVKKSDMASDINIPDDLLATLEEHDVDVDETNYHPDVLGEFDITGGSGWMYSVNGIYANVGFADYYLKDGDELRIRFTLALGNDIGLGLNNFHKEW